MKGPVPLRRRVLPILFAVLSMPAIARPVRAAEGEGPFEITFSATEISHEANPDRAVLSGVVRVMHGGVVVEADGAVLSIETGDLYAEGPILFIDERADVEGTCDRLRYNLRSKDGTFEGARLTFYPKRKKGAKGRIEMGEVTAVVVAADRIESEGGNRFIAKEAMLTSCEFATPHYRMDVREIEIVPKDYVRASGVVLYMGRVPVFYWPGYKADISAHARRMRFLLRGGQSSRWGDHWRLELGWPFRRPERSACGMDMWGLDVGFRSERGSESGLEFEWDGTAADGSLRWLTFFEGSTSIADDYVRSMRERDRAAAKWEADVYPLSPSLYLAYERGEPVLTLDDVRTKLPLETFSYAGEPRHYVELLHWSQLGGGWEVDAQVHSSSDNGVRQEYMESDAKSGLPDASFVDFHRRWSSSTLSVFTGFRTDPFRTETEYLPEVRWNVPVTTLGGGWSLGGETTAGWLRRSYDELTSDVLYASDYDAFRARTRIAVSRPFRLGPISFSPYVGTDQTYYDVSGEGNDPFVRGCAIYGGAISTRIYGRIDKGDTPFRHVIEIRAEYEGVSEPTVDSAQAPGFDDADDVMETGRARFGILQKIQTKRNGKSIDLAGLYAGCDFIENPKEAEVLNLSRQWGTLKAAAFVTPAPSVTISSSGEWDANDGRPLSSSSLIDFGHPLSEFGRNPARSYCRLGLAYITTRTPGAIPSNQIGLRFRLAPAGRWHLELRANYEIEDRSDSTPGWISQGASLVRNFHDWQVTIQAWHKPALDDYGLTFGIVPRGYTANFPPPGSY